MPETIAPIHAKIIKKTTTATVYLFASTENGRRIAPQRMWGTLAAIATLPGSVAIMESAQEAPEEALELGFLFRSPAAAPIPLTEVPRALEPVTAVPQPQY